MADRNEPMVRALGATLRLSLAVALLVATIPLHASAVSTPVLDPPLSNRVNTATTYVVHGSTTANNEQVNEAVFTFPSNADLSGVSVATVSAVEQPGSVPIPVTGVTIDPVAGTVTVAMDFLRDKPIESFDVSVGGVVNPSQPGTHAYSVRLRSNRPPTTGTLSYAVAPSPSAVSVGAAVVTTSSAAATTGVTLPITLGPTGRLAGTTALGPNTISFTFPAGYTVPASPPAGSMLIDGVATGTVSVSGNTVTLALPASLTLPGGSTTSITFDPAFGLINPPTAGGYAIDVTTSAESGTGSSPPIDVVVIAHLVVSLDAASIDFGVIYPGTPVVPATVHVTVDCDAAYVITRDVTGDVSAMGLIVTGDASGSWPGGAPMVHTDTFDVNMPWDTDPGLPLSVNVQYTVVRS